MVLIGVAGGSGSGKTTFAKKVQKGVPGENIVILSMDSYYLAKQPSSNLNSKGRANFDHPNAFDWELLRNHLERLKKGETVPVPVYNFQKSERSDAISELGPADAILFEGIFTLFDESIRELLDIKCFLHVEADIRFTRRLHRDVNERGRTLESVVSQYYDTVRPMYQKYLDPQKQHADFTVGEETDTAAQILSARIKELIKIGSKGQDERSVLEDFLMNSDRSMMNQ